jgi:regulator of sigma D
MAELVDVTALDSEKSDDEMDCIDEPTESDLEFIDDAPLETPRKRARAEDLEDSDDEEPLRRQLTMASPVETSKWKGYKSKGHFLTYPNVNDHITKEMLVTKMVDHLERKHRSFKWNDDTCWMVVAKEMHESGAPHFHVFFSLSKPLNVTSEKHFDIEWTEAQIKELIQGRQNLKWHPNLAGSARSWTAIEKYCKKDGDYIEKGKHQVQDKIAASSSKKGVAYEKAIREGILEAVESYPECLPELGKMQQGMVDYENNGDHMNIRTEDHRTTETTKGSKRCCNRDVCQCEVEALSGIPAWDCWTSPLFGSQDGLLGCGRDWEHGEKLLDEVLGDGSWSFPMWGQKDRCL